MSKIPLILVATLGLGLEAAWGAEVREKTSPPTPDRSQIDSRVRRYAEALLRQYDKNKNGVLEKDEWSQMPEQWRTADRNGDGKITLEELTAGATEMAGPLASPRSSRSRSSSQPPDSMPPMSPPSYQRSTVRGIDDSPPASSFMGETFKPSDKPLDPKAPMVEIRVLVAELATAKTSPAAPGGKSAGSHRPGALVEVDLAAPTESLQENLAKIGLLGRWEWFHNAQISIADGQRALLHLGHSLPQITGMTTSQFGRANSIRYERTGCVVGVVPRVDREGIIAVEVNVENSRMGSGDEGVPAFTSPEGEKTLSHPFRIIGCREVVRVAAGKTVVVARAGREEQGRRRELVILLSAHILELKAK
jgi:hypothetical protein